MLPEKTSKHVGPATELTCLIPIKQGFIPTLDTRTYATRLRIVFKVLQGLRVASREARAIRPVLDIVEAARTVHTFSWTILAERHLLLSVVFDRPWEPYIRVVWKDLGPLLDLFLCNCEGFVPSKHGFEPFAAYVRGHQEDTGFFYPSSSLTVDDQRYLVQLEKQQRDGGGDIATEAVKVVAPGPEALAAAARNGSPTNEAEARRQWLGVLTALYGLRNVYPEDAVDHEYLRRAASSLLEVSRPAGLPASLQAVKWFNEAVEQSPELEPRSAKGSEIQGGILTPYRKVSHGYLLLARVEDPDKARRFIGRMVDEVTHEGGDRSRDQEMTNVAFTFNGLRQLGVLESDLARFPKEFREGMDARAGLLGDVRDNHPEKWTLPEWNVHFTNSGKVDVEIISGAEGQTAPSSTSFEAEGYAGVSGRGAPKAPRPPVRMSTVDIVFVLHKIGAWTKPDASTESHPLFNRVKDFCKDAYNQGIHVLSAQPVHRLSRETETSEPKTGESKAAREHFGFVDGIKQPSEKRPVEEWSEFELGELLVGFRNNRRDAQFPVKSDDPSAWVRDSLIDKGSFLVIRKLRQNVKALYDALDQVRPPLAREYALAKMMGRRLDGEPLVAPKAQNDFDFRGDANGEVCPFHAHIRRGNPRLWKEHGGSQPPVVPRITRRGLAYGPAYRENEPDGMDRGMMFMAYNASIAEQFEIVQRWMSGGNTPGPNNGTALFSGQPDPFLGLPDSDGKRTYRFLHANTVHSVDLGPTPFVTLQWGLYLFTPSIKALGILASKPGADQKRAQAAIVHGTRVIDNLKTLEQWAAALEDISFNQSGVTAAVYAAIRGPHGGVLRTPYGVVVASHELGMRVLREDSVFSVSEYQRRFARSVGKGYLGLDSGAEYDEVSKNPNEALKLVSKAVAFETAYLVTLKALQAGVDQALTILKQISNNTRPANAPGNQTDESIPLSLEPVIDRVLAELAHTWFDIPDRILIKAGGRPEDENAARNKEDLRCPFHFLAPSRYVFSSPNPRQKVIDLGEGHGQQLLEAVRQFVSQKRHGGSGPTGEVSKKLFDTIKDEDRLARTLLGLVFGFVPTVYGNALHVLNLWLGDETLWRVQQRFRAQPDDTPYSRASPVLRDALEHAMQMRPVPPLLYRTVTVASKLGGLDLQAGDRVVVAVSAMTQDLLERQKPDVTTVFGGDRQGDSHPTHACPGYDIAMGVLLGLLGAILDFGALTPGPGLLTVQVIPFVKPQPTPAQLVQGAV